MEPVETVAAEKKVQPVARKPVAQVVPQVIAQPVAQPQLRLVQPVARKAKKAKSATGGTRQASPKSPNSLEPPSWPGCEWRISGSGWEVWRRVPSRSEHGKRSSKRTYMAYYSRKAVEAFYETETKTDTRRTEGIA